MKKLPTILGCIVLSCIGFSIAKYGEVTVSKQNTVTAANVFSYDVCRPNIVNESLNGTRIINDTVVVHDTVTVTKTKYVQEKRKPGNTTDTIYIPFPSPAKVEGVSVNGTNSKRDRKVFTPDDEPSSKPANVTLFIDGEKVYSSETVITPIPHIQIDGLQEP